MMLPVTYPLRAFMRTHLPITRLSLLHLAVVHMKDLVLLKKMIEHLCYDPCSPECSDLLKEYLVGSGDFLESCEDDRKASEIKKQNMVMDTFASHLHIHLPRETKVKTHNIAVEYVKYQAVQTDALLRLFWSGLGYSSDTNPCTTHLTVQGTTQEIALLQVVERYFTSVTDLKFPLPPGKFLFEVCCHFNIITIVSIIIIITIVTIIITITIVVIIVVVFISPPPPSSS
ncbi:hypothetical protein QZH41_003275 [Actinostola sp. cb2023]|nr:hypothetical protein QZH41_003275 [Actinostola sp. cb2023]